METPLVPKESEFLLPVDSECKATVIRPWRISGVHMRAFHASWMSMFVSFFSTFAPAALSVTIRDALDLTDKDISNANIASVSGAIISRILLGSVCDTFGPRLAHTSTLLITSLGVFGLVIVDSPTGYIICRFIIGLSLGTFVACLYWSSVMFNVKIVGRSNATGGGAGASGGGITQFVMPLIFSLFTCFSKPFLAWRLSFFVPGTLHLLVSLRILTTTQDLPDGSYQDLIKKGTMKRSSSARSTYVAVSNHRVWLCTLAYACTFGIELTVDNVATTYFFDNFSVSSNVAGMLGASFGTLNFLARPLGGLLSDITAKVYGMRGRLTVSFCFHVSSAIALILVSLAHKSVVLTIILMVICAVLTEAAQASLFSIVPFVSKRSLGVVMGLVGAGGNLGAALIAFIFFNPSRFDTKEGFLWTGVASMIGSLQFLLIRFPMWGGIFTGPTPGATEIDYYLREYTPEEVMNGLADRSIKFATESESMRGRRGNKDNDNN